MISNCQLPIATVRVDGKDRIKHVVAWPEISDMIILLLY